MQVIWVPSLVSELRSHMPNGTDKGKQTNKKVNSETPDVEFVDLKWKKKEKENLNFIKSSAIPWNHIELMKISSGRSLGWKGAHSWTSLVKTDKHYALERENLRNIPSEPDSSWLQVYSLYFCYWMLSMILFSYLPAHTFTHTEPAVTWNRFC